MQVKKDEVRDLILEVAKNEFMEKGFTKASLREIAAKAGVTKGNIYTYFESKDGLFLEIVNPVWSFIKNSMTEGTDENCIRAFSGDLNLSASSVIEQFSENVTYLYKHFDPLKLLFTASAGSCLEDFREQVFHLYTQSAKRFLRVLAENGSIEIPEISEMFIHTLAALYLRLLEEVIIHKPGAEELDRYIEEMGLLVSYGLKALIDRNTNITGGNDE